MTITKSVICIVAITLIYMCYAALMSINSAVVIEIYEYTVQTSLVFILALSIVLQIIIKIVLDIFADLIYIPKKIKNLLLERQYKSYINEILEANNQYINGNKDKALSILNAIDTKRMYDSRYADINLERNYNILINSLKINKNILINLKQD